MQAEGGSERVSNDGTSLEMSIGLTNKIISSYLLFIKFSQEAIVSCSLIDTIVSQSGTRGSCLLLYLFDLVSHCHAYLFNCIEIQMPLIAVMPLL